MDSAAVRRAGTTPEAKLRLLHRDFNGDFHRAGMSHTLDLLGPLWRPDGVVFDPMIESTFGWREKQPPIPLPIDEPWIGIAHHPPAMPPDYFDELRPQHVFAKASFLDSLASCRGLFALSDYHAAWLRQFGVPVEVLLHPTRFDVPAFDFDRLCAAERRPLLHIGWWLRKFESFNRLRAPGYQKMMPSLPHRGPHYLMSRVRWEPGVTMLGYLPPDDYDALLTRAVVFADLVDCSANNVVLDCIARATPLVMNRHPAAAEYLGKDYPLFFDTLDHATALLQDDDRLREASAIMRSPAIRRRLTVGAFAVALAGSHIYRSLAV